MQLKVPSDREPGSSPRVVLLTAGGPMAAAVANALSRQFPGLIVLQEDPEPKWGIVRRRARRLGWCWALGQAACAVYLMLTARRSRQRIGAIITGYGLDPNLRSSIQVRHIGSVNMKQCRDALRLLNPDVVAVYGTRIIRRETLRSIPAPFINYHAGINPKYRGQHPGYWALVNADPDHAGVTIHLVDEGVDTGDVLYQERVPFTQDDNIRTYQWLQMAYAMPLFIRAIQDTVAGRLAPKHAHLPSRQWFPPTVWAYAWNGLTRGVW